MEIQLEAEFLTGVKEKYGISGRDAGKSSGSRDGLAADHEGDTFTCHCFVDGKEALFAGRGDGQIIAWRSNKAHSELKDVSLKGHKGGIHCILYVPNSTSGILLTGSAGNQVYLMQFFTMTSCSCSS